MSDFSSDEDLPVSAMIDESEVVGECCEQCSYFELRAACFEARSANIASSLATRSVREVSGTARKSAASVSIVVAGEESRI